MTAVVQMVSPPHEGKAYNLWHLIPTFHFKICQELSVQADSFRLCSVKAEGVVSAKPTGEPQIVGPPKMAHPFLPSKRSCQDFLGMDKYTHLKAWIALSSATTAPTAPTGEGGEYSTGRNRWLIRR